MQVGYWAVRYTTRLLVKLMPTVVVKTISGSHFLLLQVGWWWRWMPGEAWELLRISSLKTLRALQTLGKLATQLASDISKHRY